MNRVILFTSLTIATLVVAVAIWNPVRIVSTQTITDEYAVKVGEQMDDLGVIKVPVYKRYNILTTVIIKQRLVTGETWTEYQKTKVAIN